MVKEYDISLTIIIFFNSIGIGPGPGPQRAEGPCGGVEERAVSSAKGPRTQSPTLPRECWFTFFLSASYQPFKSHSNCRSRPSRSVSSNQTHREREGGGGRGETVAHAKKKREGERVVADREASARGEQMDRYKRVDKPKPETPINENEIRITTQGRMRNYITYATTLLQEKGSDEIVLKAMGRAINKTVMISELIKRRISGLHQNTSIGSIDITDTWEPLEEGLLPLETTRHVSMITITFSKKELNTSSTGYQPPLPADQVKPLNEYDDEADGSPRMRGRTRGRGRGRGRVRGSYNGPVEFNGDGWDAGYSFGGRGYGRGRGRSFQGRGRGYGGQSGGYYDYGEYEAPPAQGRGRGLGRGRGRGRGRITRWEGPVEAAAA